jgi:hypothetical protein
VTTISLFFSSSLGVAVAFSPMLFSQEKARLVIYVFARYFDKFAEFVLYVAAT